MANVITIVGHLVRDVEVRGEKNTIFATAILDSRKNEEPLFFNLSFLGENWAKVMSYLKKGSFVQVTGRLSKRKYVDKKTGETEVSLNVLASSLDFLNTGYGPKSSSTQDETSAPSTTRASDNVENDEDIPF